ncbi:conjugal transfer protein TraJ [Wolbachia endosymbiont of Carposina sasakii]|uniref:type IV secretion system protein VirB8 n=1 Tax=Wolbachia TaxID=953 RepID=UPI0002D24E09|nr:MULTISPECIES: type IV secretion system protein VirB8 [Wolbachia]AGK00130.1 Type IV secretion system protein VirB8, putative [Wolbachia endosymbiont of Drosophila simulans wHa]MBH5362711.1 conjugal transfer protein TraJ [Wolbachia endosymbiont of Kradibia gibbosae]QDH19127.1 conjugal transfer protein TraJ [Wolbachia endosymbiont of Carposina sasakii]QTP62805.1 conjugal transfer protein TraJ [Wolbachia endosymbiont of Ceratosolen solmsi]
MEDKLLESVKNKSYFSKAVEWYCHRYLFCVAERSWMALIVSLLLVCLCLLTLNIYLLFPVKKDLNFVKYMNHTEDEFSAMHKLSFSKKEDEYTSTARYLISKYIEVYESIKTVEPKYQENFIRNNSIHKIHQGFQEKTNNEAVSSKRKITNINVITLSIDRSTKDLVTFAGNATVVFTTEQNKEDTVEISFTLSNIKATLAGIIPFKFIVNGYKYRF